MSEPISADTSDDTAPWCVVPEQLSEAEAREWAVAAGREFSGPEDDPSALIDDLAEWAGPGCDREDSIRLAYVLGTDLPALRVYLEIGPPSDHQMRLSEAEQDSGDSMLEYFTCNGHSGRVLSRRVPQGRPELRTEHQSASRWLGDAIVGVNRILPDGTPFELLAITSTPNVFLLASGIEGMKQLLSGDEIMALLF